MTHLQTHLDEALNFINPTMHVKSDYEFFQIERQYSLQIKKGAFLARTDAM